MDKTAKRKPKIQAKRALSMLLVAAILIAGAFAFLTAQDSKTNVFTIGNVDIDLIEDFDVNTDKELDPDTEHFVDEQPPVVEDIVPGQEILKQPYIENTGSNDAWVYLVVKQPTATAEQIAGIDGSLTETQQEIVINAYAFQDNYKGAKTAEDVWTAYAPDLDGDAEHSTESRELIFELKGIDTTNWTRLDDESFLSEDGYYYEVYAYNTMLPAKDNDTTANVIEDQTSKLFTSVKLNSDIESAKEHIVKFMSGSKFVTAVPFASNNSVITIPDDAEKWAAPNGRVCAAGSTVKVSDLLKKELKEIGDDLVVVTINEDVIVMDAIAAVDADSASSTSIPKLVPKTTSSTAMIERDGIVETYNSVTSAEMRDDVSVEAVNSTRYVTPDTFENYFVYGILPTEIINNDDALSLLENALDINGEGYFVIEKSLMQDYGTGALIKVYNNDDQLVEQFTCIMFGDINGDALLNAADSGIFKAAFLKKNFALSSELPMLLKSGDSNGDGVFDMADYKAHTIVLKSKSIDQITGYYLDIDGPLICTKSVITIKYNDETIEEQYIAYNVTEGGKTSVDLNSIITPAINVLGLDANKNATTPTYPISTKSSTKGTVSVTGVTSDTTLYVIYSANLSVYNYAHTMKNGQLTSINPNSYKTEFEVFSTFDTSLVGINGIPDGYTFLGWHIIKASDIEEHVCYDIASGDPFDGECTKTFTAKDVDVAPNGTFTVTSDMAIDFGGVKVYIAPVIVPAA